MKFWQVPLYVCFIYFEGFQERNLQICREWISNFPFQMLARCSWSAVQTSQVGSKIPNKWQQFASPVTKSPSAILPSGNSEVQKVIFALSNFENVSKTLPKIGFWCEVQFARCHFTETSSDGNFKNLFNDILPYHMIKYYQNPREIHLSRLEINPDAKL